MQLARLILRGAPIVNAPLLALNRSPRWSRLLGGSVATLHYTGRKSGREVSLPVAYRRGDDVAISVAMPDAKSWWRNFSGEGAPLTVTLDGRDRSGHGVATRDENGAVTVRVQLRP